MRGHRVKFDYSAVSEIDWARLAAWIDGEGSFVIARYDEARKYQRVAVRIVVSQSDIRLMSWLQSIWGGHVSRNGGHNKPCYNWTVTGLRVDVIIEHTRKYLIVKGEQADIAKAYRATLTREWNYHGGRGNRVPAELWNVRRELERQMQVLKPRRRGAAASKLSVAPTEMVQ